MLVYYILLLYFGIASTALYNAKTRRRRKSLAILLGLGLFLVMSCRKYTVGVDTERYVDFFSSLDGFDTGLFIFYEPGYILFISILKAIGCNEQGYIATTSLLFSASTSIFIYRYSKNIPFSFFIHVTFGLFVFSMSAIRQSMAISIIMLAMPFVFERRLLSFTLFILLATSFHYSAIIFLPVYFLYHENGGAKIRALINFSCVAFLLSVAILGIESLDSLSIEKYSARYLDGADQGSLNPLVIIVAATIPFGVAVLRKMGAINPSIQDRYQDDFFFNLLLFVLFFTVLALNIHMAIRLSSYFAPAYLISVPNSLARVQQHGAKIAAFSLMVFLFLLYFTITTPNGILEVGNYTFFFE